MLQQVMGPEPSEDELSDDDQFYQGQGINTMVRLNKQEEDELIKDLEMQAQGNDTLKELDEALMDRITA